MDSIRLSIRLLGPVHVGTGRTLGKADYFPDSGTLARIDTLRMIEDAAFSRYAATFEQGVIAGRPVWQMLPRDLLLRHVLYRAPVAQDLKGDLLVGVEVAEQIKSGGRGFLPGSSLKGVLVSAVLWDALARRKVLPPREVEDLFRRVDRWEELADRVLARIARDRLGDSGRTRRWLDVSDTNTVAASECLRVDRVHGREGLPACEVLREGTEFEFRVSVPSGTGVGTLYTARDVIQAAQQYYYRVREAVGWRGYTGSNPLLRVGAGSTKWATSFHLVARDLGIRGPARPYGRGWSVGDRLSPGWVEITNMVAWETLRSDAAKQCPVPGSKIADHDRGPSV